MEETLRTEERTGGPTADPDATQVIGVEPATQVLDAHKQEGRGGRVDVPALAAGIELLGEYEGSGYKETPYLARRADGQVIQLTYLLHLVADAVDGKRDHAAIADKVTEGFGRHVSADNVRFLVEKKLRPLGVLAEADGSSPAVKKLDPLLVLKFKTVLIPEKLVNILAAAFRPLFWPPVILGVLTALIAFDVWFFSVHGIAQSIRGTLYQPAIILLIYGLLLVSIAWHEIGHATACRYGGARPGVIGFGIYVVWPAFYNDVTDAYRLSKAGKVRTDLGGIYFNLIFTLAVGGAYALTSFEPLLVVVLMQHLLIVYQFMPFLRLDGYYVISDLTGVPDLFGRVKPTLRSLVPWKETEEPVRELKPWVRLIVTLWVMTMVPLMLYLFLMMVISAPRVLATGFDSFMTQLDELARARAEGRDIAVASGGLQMAMLVLPAVGMAVTTSRMAKRTVQGSWRVTEGRPVVRIGLFLVLGSAAALAGSLLIPNGEYKPIQPGETWTLSNSVDALEEVSGGRPSLSTEEEDRLGGAPTTRGVDDPSDPVLPPSPSPTDEGSDETGISEPETTPTPDATPMEEEVTPTPEEETTPTPIEETPTPEE
jgi:putative peptide zinc metalloprotease protein